MERTCELCGKVFETKSSRRRRCYDEHYHPCPVCGKPVITSDLHHVDNCCSLECSRKKAVSTIKENFDAWPADSESAKAKRLATVREKYGVDNPFQSDMFKEKSKRTSMRKYGVPYPAQSPELQERVSETNLRRYGVKRPLQNPEIQSKFVDMLRDKYGDPELRSTLQLDSTKEKIRNTNNHRYGVDNPMQNHDIWAKQSSKRSGYTASDGTKLDSTYELDFYEYCLRVGVEVERSYPIEYEYSGQGHTTYIDFKIGNLLFEVKGPHLLDGLYDYRGVPISRKLELYREHHVIVVTDSSKRDMFGRPNSAESNGLKYLHKCPNPLIGVDIDLFREPTFPYRDDRPRCFYDVKVDGKRSAAEGFADEALRWKMVVNRIMYSGGFIDAKQVLNALNITRNCKQPSWFSKSLAKKVISGFCSSGIIFDPFAGWGARHDAAIELGREYVGADLNPDLVEWHHEQGRGSIQLADANGFTCDAECSIFICPPYSDPESGRCFEDYNFDGFDSSAKARSQCDWLKVAISNAPNLVDATMVCKVVDPGWERFVAGTKTNRSHFGRNNEYVIHVTREDVAELP